MSFIVRIDRPTDLGHPQGHAVVIEKLEGVAELVAVKGSLGLTDYHGVKPSIGVAKLGEQDRSLWPALWGNRSRLVDVEELRDDHATSWLDQ